MTITVDQTMRALRSIAAWLLAGHAGLCGGCGRHSRVRVSLDGFALLCKRCDRRSFGGVPPFPRGRLR